MFGFRRTQRVRLGKALAQINAGKAQGLEDLFSLASENYPEAEYWLGDIYEFTKGDFPEAAKWYKMAAEHGHPKSQWCIANFYITGKGLQHDPNEAVRWYRAAAANNIPEAQFFLGESYRVGDYISKDTNLALSWYQKAASAGYEPAQMRIQQFWPDGSFHDRRPSADAADKPELREPLMPLCPEVASFYGAIISAAQERGYIPQDEIPNVPELIPHQQQIVSLICTYINDDMKTRGLDGLQMLAVFTFVFQRTFEAMYAWHRSSDGKIGSITVGNPFNDKHLLQLPSALIKEIENIEAPKMICSMMSNWWDDNGGELRSKGIDIWQPLTASLFATSGVAVSIALKMLGYRK